MRSEGYRTALLTNNVREWEDRRRTLAPIEDMFDVVVDGALFGMRKPGPEIYELTAARLGATGQACVFVDDRQGSGVPGRGCIARRTSHSAGGAAAVGMFAVL